MKKQFLTSRNIFSIENQMRRETQGEKKHKKKQKKHVTVLQFVPNHRYAIHVWKIVPRNHVYGSWRFHMFMVHVERSGAVLPFFPRGFYSITATRFMFGIWWPPMFTYFYHLLCVLLFSFIVFVYFLVPFNVFFIFIYFHLCSFMFIYFHLCSFIFMCSYLLSFLLFLSFPFFLSWKKNITNLNHLHVDPRLSSVDVIQILRTYSICIYIYNSQNLFHFFETNCCLFLGKKRVLNKV